MTLTFILYWLLLVSLSIQECLRKTMKIPFLLPVQEHCHYFYSFFFYLSKPFSFDMHKDPAALQYCGDWAPGMMTKLEVHVTALAQFSVIAAAAWTQVTGPVPLTWDPAYTSHVTITCQVETTGQLIYFMNGNAEENGTWCICIFFCHCMMHDTWFRVNSPGVYSMQQYPDAGLKITILQCVPKKDYLISNGSKGKP